MSFLNDHNDSAASQTLESILDTTTLRSKLILVQGLLFVTATAKKSASQRCANVEWNLSGSIPQVEGLNPSETGFLISKIGCVIIRAGLCDVPDTQVFKNW